MAEYRWNQSEMAAGYDAAAEFIHPHYRLIQDRTIDLFGKLNRSEGKIIDLGCGSGRWAEQCLERFPQVRLILIDQSNAFLDLARQRLGRFANQVEFHQFRLQEDWYLAIREPVDLIVSMSAIHHLDPQEKQQLYRRCYRLLSPGGLFLNGDEVRPESDPDYLAECQKWGRWMQAAVAAGQIPPVMAEGLRKWQQRNIEQFGEPRKSGDDCHETLDRQLEYLRQAGFEQADSPWQAELWAILRGQRLA